MQFLKDKEKEQLKELVKACLLEISKLKMDLKKCKDGSEIVEIDDPELIGEFKDTQLQLEKKEAELLELKEKLQVKESHIAKLKREIEHEKGITKSLEEKENFIERTVEDKDLHIKQLKSDFEKELEDKEREIINITEDYESRLKKLKLKYESHIKKEENRSLSQLNQLKNEFQKKILDKDHKIEKIKDEFQNKIEKKNLEITKLKTQLINKDNQKSEILKDIELKKTEIYDLQRRTENMEELKNLLEKKDLKIIKLQNKLDDNAIEVNNEKMAQLESKLLEFNEIINDMEKELSQFNKEIKTKNSEITLLKKEILQKENQITSLKDKLGQKEKQFTGKQDQKESADLKDLKEIKKYFELLTARPKKDLTSFQSQVYQILPFEEGTTKDLHNQITRIAFKELSYENFNFILKNLERKNYVKSFKKDGKLYWKKQDK